jgi:AraC family transcriptional regulator
MSEHIERVIALMRSSLGEPLTVDDLAREAMFSKFHFTRMFTRATGLSPQRFLSAMRLEEAKRLLLTTAMTVTEISYRVGYHSVGTFTSRFGETVGAAPTTFRRQGGVITGIGLPPAARCIGATVTATIRAPTDVRVGRIFVGMFPKVMPDGSPVRCTVMGGPGTYRFDDVPLGRWYVAAMTGPPLAETGGLFPDAGVYLGAFGPFHIHAGTTVQGVIQLVPKLPIHPPILCALRPREPGRQLSY